MNLLSACQSRLIALGLFLAVLAGYSIALTCGFVGIDDPNHLLENPLVLRGDVLGAFTRPEAGLWIPLTWLSFMGEYALVGPSPWLYHFTNVLLHVVNAILVWRWLEQMTGRRWAAATVAMIFAIHPLNVESVAWVTERKNVLSTCFWLLGLMAWTRYAKEGKRGDYWLTVLAAAASLMSKPMAVTFAGTLFLVDFWPLARHTRTALWKLLVEKIPFLVLAIGVSFMTVHAHASLEGLVAAGSVTPSERLLNAAAAYGRYVRQIFWPVDLAVLVRHPQRIPLGESVLGIVLLLLGSVAAWVFRRRQPAITWGWLWYLGTLVPVCGLVQAGTEASADRFTYVPLLGIYVALVWASAPWAERQPKIFSVLGVALGCFWLGLTIRQVGYWDNSIALFDRTLAINPQSYKGLINSGFAHARQGEYKLAIQRYRAAVDINPNDADLWNMIGSAMARSGDDERAATAFGRALKLKPGHPLAQRNLELIEERKKAARP